MLDRHGRVIGIATLTAKEGQNVNFARSSRDLAKFLSEIQADAKPVAFSQPTPKPTLDSEPDYFAAVDANDKRDGARALELVNKLLLRYPNSVNLLFERGRAYFNLSLYEDAFSAYRQYVKVKPSEPAAWHNMALSAFNANRYDEAFNAALQAVKMRPDPDTWRMISVISASRQDWASANLAMEQAKKAEAEHRKVSSAAPITALSPVGTQRQVYCVVHLPRGGELNVRADPRANSPVVAKLRPGDHVYFDNERFQNAMTTWDKVTSFSDHTGWVNTDYVDLEKQ